MTDISGKSLHEIYKEDARKYKEPIKLTGNFDKREALTVTMPMEEFDKLEKLALSAHTDKLSVEKIQEIRVEELKDFNSKILQAELKNQKLQEQLYTAKKALTESEKMYQKQMDRFLNSEMNESARSHCESQLKLLFPSHKAYEALAAIGGDDE